MQISSAYCTIMQSDRTFFYPVLHSSSQFSDSSLTSCVRIFASKLYAGKYEVIAFQKYCEGAYGKYGKAPKNVFQRLAQGSQFWKGATLGIKSGFPGLTAYPLGRLTPLAIARRPHCVSTSSRSYYDNAGLLRETNTPCQYFLHKPFTPCRGCLSAGKL
jgi:hypothetical protein